MFLILAIPLILYLLYRWSLPDATKWEAKGVKVVKPFPLLGSYPGGFFARKPLIETFRLKYQELKQHDLVVYFVLKSPALLVNDPELIKEILVKNFDHYVDRNVLLEINKVHNKVMGKMLINLRGEEWKSMRAGLSPAFTTGKLKNIVSAMNKAGPVLNEYLARQIEQTSSGVVEVKEVFGRYTMGVIAQAVYGIDAKVFEEETSEFVKNATAIQPKLSLRMLFAVIAYMLVPKLAMALGIRLGPKEPFEFFSRITKTLMAQRSEKASNDMLQLLVDLRNKGEDGQTSSEPHEDFESDAKLSVKVDQTSVMDEEGIVQSALLFLLAGFDTTANTLSLVSYFLAIYPDVQAKAREEVDMIADELGGDDNQLTYDEVNRLEYIDMVLSETLRVAPIAPLLDRKCTKNHTLSNGVLIEEGTWIQFPIIGLHTDPKYWEDPDKFMPERFSKENRKKVLPYTYLPFGLGPRNCIGMRFAIMEIKVAIFHLLRGFFLEPSEKTLVPPTFDAYLPLTSIAGGNFLKLIPRNV